MRLRTLSDLQEAVDNETAWRRRELTTALMNVQGSRGSKIQVNLRAGVALLYAHWEGWVKALGRLYIEYVNTQGPCFEDLSPAFLGNALRTRLDSVSQALSAQIHVEFGSFLLDSGLKSKVTLNPDLIRTSGNLSSSVLRDVTTRLGLPYAPYETRSNLIDEKLVRRRNNISHGDYLEVDEESYEELHQKVLEMLNRFTADLLNAAATRAYLHRNVNIAAGRNLPAAGSAGTVEPRP